MGCCRKCNSKLKEAWAYCPYCGAERAATLNKGFNEVFQCLEKQFRDIFGSNFPGDFPFGKGFTVEIMGEHGTPKVSLRELGHGMEGIRPASSTHVLEPHVLIKDGGRVLQVQLPLVKTEEDVSIRKLENSLEVKARAGEVVYFTIIPHSKFPKLVKHGFRRGVLTLKFS